MINLINLNRYKKLLRIFIYYKKWHKSTFYPQRKNCYATHSSILTLLTSKEFNSPIKLPKFSNTWLISVISLLWLVCDEAMINCSKDFSPDATALWWNVLEITNVHPLFPPIFMLDKNDVPWKKKRQTELDYYPIKPLTKQADLFGLKASLWPYLIHGIYISKLNEQVLKNSQFIRRKLLAIMFYLKVLTHNNK